VVDKKALSFFSSLVAELPQDWQLLYLGYDKNETAPANAGLKKIFYHLIYTLGIKKKFNHAAINKLYPRPYSEHLQEAGFHDCTHAYAITKEAAEILLAKQSPVTYSADNLLALSIVNSLLKAFIPRPKLINQQYQVNPGSTVSYLR
jgi:glycosyl transferase, family 25